MGMIIKKKGSWLLKYLVVATYGCVCFDVNTTNKRGGGEVTNYDSSDIEVWN